MPFWGYLKCDGWIREKLLGLGVFCEEAILTKQMVLGQALAVGAQECYDRAVLGTWLELIRTQGLLQQT